MAQHDYVIDNQSAPSFRADLNNALLAIATTNGGASAPATPYANQLWVDTNNNQLKIRNEDNDAWIVIADLNQTADTSAPPDGSVTFAKLADGSVTFAKLAGAAVVTSSETIASNNNDTTIPTSAAVDAHIPAKLNASGSAPIYACRAWVNFNGTNGAIRASGNVSSVVRNGVGNYTINFTTAMPDASYAFVGTARDGLTRQLIVSGVIADSTASQCNVATIDDAGTARDADVVSVSIFR